MKKKVLFVDDSALMRRMFCDIIESDERFQVTKVAYNGLEALEILEKESFDVVVMDLNMPRMSGIEVLKALNEKQIPAKVVMNSSLTAEGAAVTIEALELGAFDFIQKPVNIMETQGSEYKQRFLQILDVASKAPMPRRRKVFPPVQVQPVVNTRIGQFRPAIPIGTGSGKVVAIASSTGGPKALQSVISKLPKELNAPVVIVQHMPKGFTASLAARLNDLSPLAVKEAQEGDVLENGKAYLAMGGAHLNIDKQGARHVIRYSNEPPREGVCPCANYMYESLMTSGYAHVVCVVLTGMGADGTQGIVNLNNRKDIFVIAQEESTCAVYGMPRAIVAKGLVNEIVPIDLVAKEIITNVGVR